MGSANFREQYHKFITRKHIYSLETRSWACGQSDPREIVYVIIHPREFNAFLSNPSKTLSSSTPMPYMLNLFSHGRAQLDHLSLSRSSHHSYCPEALRSLRDGLDDPRMEGFAQPHGDALGLGQLGTSRSAGPMLLHLRGLVG